VKAQHDVRPRIRNTITSPCGAFERQFLEYIIRCGVGHVAVPTGFLGGHDQYTRRFMVSGHAGTLMAPHSCRSSTPPPPAIRGQSGCRSTSVPTTIHLFRFQRMARPILQDKWGDRNQVHYPYFPCSQSIRGKANSAPFVATYLDHTLCSGRRADLEKQAARFRGPTLNKKHRTHTHGRANADRPVSRPVANLRARFDGTNCRALYQNNHAADFSKNLAAAPYPVNVGHQNTMKSYGVWRS